RPLTRRRSVRARLEESSFWDMCRHQLWIYCSERRGVEILGPINWCLKSALLDHELCELVRIVNETIVERHVVAYQFDHRDRPIGISLNGSGPNLRRFIGI